MNNVNKNNNNNLISSDSATHYYHYYTSIIPRSAIYILVFLFFLGFGVSLFILIEVHSVIFFLSFLFISTIVVVVLIWNVICFRRKNSLLLFLESFPVSDLRFATHGQLVKISGSVSCGEVSLDSSYEKVGKCVYTSTVVYEYQGFGFSFKALSAKDPFFLWRVACFERLSTDFYISDRKSGIRTLVKAGCGCRLIPLVVESRLVHTRRNRILSPNLTRWLADRSLKTNSGMIRLEEGYIKEGDTATVIGMLHRVGDDITMVVHPPELISTGCLWQRLLLPVDFDGLLLGTS